MPAGGGNGVPFFSFLAGASLDTRRLVVADAPVLDETLVFLAAADTRRLVEGTISLVSLDTRRLVAVDASVLDETLVFLAALSG